MQSELDHDLAWVSEKPALDSLVLNERVCESIEFLEILCHVDHETVRSCSIRHSDLLLTPWHILLPSKESQPGFMDPRLPSLVALSGSTRRSARSSFPAD